MSQLEFVARKGNSMRLRYGVITFDVTATEHNGKRVINKITDIYFPPAFYSKVVALTLAQLEIDEGNLNDSHG